MKKIAFVVPYFGKLPKGFAFWLLSCSTNTTIDWLIFTDDKTEYSYPSNVKVTYCEFSDIQKRVYQLYGDNAMLNRPYKLCDFKPAYGEIFEEELKEYDFWGHCDIDLAWGNIRKFITDDILDKYDKIGNQGHCTLYRNTKEVNSRVRTCIDGLVSYKEAFYQDKSFAFDEPPMEKIYKALNIPYYMETNYVHLTKYDYGFFMGHKPDDEAYKNEYQIFALDNGELFRYYLENDEVKQEEYMYIHFWCRPISFKIKEYSNERVYLMYPEVVTDKSKSITAKFIKNKGTHNPIRFYAKSIWFNRKKITLERIIFNIKGRINYKHK